MANTNSAKKRNRQNIKHRSRNRWRLTTMRTAIKDLREQVLHGSVSDAEKALVKTCAVIDKAASKGAIHRNTASRYKSRLNARVKAKKLATG
ncbi:MAG: 30S ribosomal protein S20 [Phycisphaerales bacterium JB043]